MTGLLDLIAQPSLPAGSPTDALLVAAMERAWQECNKSGGMDGVVLYVPGIELAPRVVIRRRGRKFVLSAVIGIHPDFIKSMEEARAYWNRN